MRKVHEIAQEIRKVWTKPSAYALPYLNAMSSLETIQDPYYLDSGYEIVARFLCNASTFRGEDARRIKAELNLMLKGA